jgi:ABC-type transport auxiliary lipoprotein component
VSAPGLRRRRRVAAGWLALAAAACQPLPHPFADDVPKPGSPILTLRDMTSVSIAPLQGTPRATAEKLAPAMAAALQKHDIAASARTSGRDSYKLSGLIQEMPAEGGKAALVALWQLRDRSGKLLGERAERTEAPAGDWRTGNEDSVARAAAAGADQLAVLMEDKAPVEAEAGGETKLLIRGVEGAPGDGAAALTNAIALLLKRQDVAIVSGQAAKADLVLDADVAVTPAPAGKEHVKIVWHVRRSDGGEIGTVGQENDVPKGLLDGPWGDVAYSVAAAAQDGIMALVSRGAPPATGKS